MQEITRKERALASLRLHCQVFAEHLSQEKPAEDANHLQAIEHYAAGAFNGMMVSGCIDACLKAGASQEEILLILTEHSILEKLAEIEAGASPA